MNAGLTLAAALTAATNRLRAAGVDAPRRDARLLMARALRADEASLVAGSGHVLERRQAAAFAALVRRRSRREPLSHVIGRREFWSLNFTVGPAVLDPRPDSECLVEAALAFAPGRGAPLRVLDLGTGSGCLLLAVLSERPLAKGVGVDAAPAALELARRNARDLGLEPRARFVRGDWGRRLRGPFDLVLCNPPYVRTGDIAALEPEVARFEPRLALDGGPDGLDAYRRLLPDLARLARKGVGVVEIGDGQAGAVSAIAAQAGLTAIARREDLAGRARCLVFTAAGNEKKTWQVPACALG
jgi:release factor glutamine methyltransferase